MRVKYYSIFDVLAEEFGPLFVAKNDAVAARMYKNLALQERVNPSDYSLRFVLELDTENGFVFYNRPREVDIEISVKDCIDGPEIVDVVGVNKNE